VPPSSKRLIQDIRRLEERLRCHWARQAPPLSHHLRGYRQDWLKTFEVPMREATASELTSALLAADPVLVGDFHSLRRPRRSLGTLVRNMPEGESPALLLELLPAHFQATAKEVLNDPKYQLVNGRPARDVYESPLRAAAKRNGIVVGAWIDASPQKRDLAAAKQWSQLRLSKPNYRWLLFFGNWHLADSHLPESIRNVGGNPAVLHQSPEPIWEKAGHPKKEQLIRLGAGHWAWLHTPPLAQWASELQDAPQDDSELCAEIAEEMVDSLASGFAECLGLPAPQQPPSVWPADQWPAFWSTLPNRERLAFSEETAPLQMVLHPHLPAIWTPANPLLNSLVEAGGHCLLTEHPLSQQTSPEARLLARAFRRVWARFLNPFLRETSLSEIGSRLFPESKADWNLGWDSILKAWEDRQMPFLEPQQRVLAYEYFGGLFGASLVQNGNLDHQILKEILDGEWMGFNWPTLVATMRAA